MNIFRNIRDYTFLSIVVFFCNKVSAQLCSGSLGDAIINISFDNTSPLIYTGYSLTGACPEPGQYSLQNFLFGCAHNTWYVINGDHTRSVTGNLNSNIMMVNGQDNPNFVMRDTVNNLCGNITYQFAAYIANLMKPNACGGNPVLPNLSFIVETDKGKLLANYTTGDLNILDQILYKQYGVCFTTPPEGGNIVLSIKSNPVSGCGAVFGMDDITLQPCGSRITVTVNNNYQPYTYACAGYKTPFVLRASYSGFTKPKQFWQYSNDTGVVWHNIPGALADTYTVPPIDSGVILYRIIVAEDVNINSPQCRSASQRTWIQVNPLPPHQPLRTLTGCLDKDLTLPFIAGGTFYNWQGPNSFQSISYTPIIANAQYKDSGLYTLTITNNGNCSTKDSLVINVYPSSTVSVTPAFSICEGQQIQFNAFGGETYLWIPPTGLSNPSIPNPTLTPNDSIKYKVIVNNKYGCKDSAMVSVNVNRKLYINAGADKYILSKDTATLTAEIKGTAVNFYWSPDNFINDVHSLNPKVNPAANTMYTLHARSGVGCGSGTDNVNVYIYHDIYVPNAFTPNGDGNNDFFRIVPLENYTLERFTIYNRWGNVVFNTSSPGKGWDGNFNNLPQPMGTYVYYIKLHSPNGKNIIKKGTVLLLR